MTNDGKYTSFTDRPFYFIMDERAWMDIDSALELEGCSSLEEVKRSARHWPNSVVVKVDPDGRRTIIDGTNHIMEEES